MNDNENEATAHQPQADDVASGPVEAPTHCTPGTSDELESENNFQPAVETNAVTPGTGTAPNTNSSQDLAATGKFTRTTKKLFELGSKELEERLLLLSDDEFDCFARCYGKSELKQTGFLARWRCVCGAICTVKRARIRECYKLGIPTISWRDWCTLVGLNRKTAERYEQNWRTVIDAPKNLSDAANREGLDLHQPRIANHLRDVLKELAGQEPTEAELPELLTRLDQPAPPENKKKKNRTKQEKPKSIAAARQSFSRAIAKIPEKEMEKADPLFHTFASVPPAAQMSVVVRSLFWQFVQSAPTDQQLSVAETFVDAAQAELDRIREQLNRPTGSVESTGELAEENLEQAEPSPDLVVDDLSPLSELNAEPVSEPVTKPPVKPRRKLLLDFDDENDVFTESPAVLKLKPVTSEAFNEAFVDSLAAGL